MSWTAERRLARGLRALFALLFCAFGVLLLGLVWRHLNYVQMDLAGHMASAAAFRRGLYHRFDDAHFLGSIHGLFYPPLEDAILAGASVLARDDYVLAYKVYLSGLVIAYLGSAWALGARLGSTVARLFFLGLVLYLVNLDKPSLREYQGLSACDLLLTGLSGEFLAGIFFLLLLREILGKARAAPMGALLALAILSHIVVACAALLVLVALLPARRHLRSAAVAILGALGLAAGFLVPFAAHRGALTASMIFLHVPAGFAALAGLGALVAVRAPEARAFLGSAFLLLLPPLVGPALERAGLPVPRFHYHRFAILGLLLATAGFAALLERRRAGRLGRGAAALCALGFAGLVVHDLRLMRYDTGSPGLRATTLDLGGMPPRDERDDADGYGRTWVVGEHRAADSGLDSLLSIEDDGFRSVGGLYWESSRDNTLLSSYLATALGPPMVIDYFQHPSHGCAVGGCLLEHFASDYNVKRLVVDEAVELRYVPEEHVQCYRQMLASSGTAGLRLAKKGEIYEDGTTFGVFDLEPRRSPAEGGLSTSAVETFTADRLNAIAATASGQQSHVLQDVFAHCSAGETAHRVYLPRDELLRMKEEIPQAFRRAPAAVGSARAELRKVGTGRFEITVDAAQPVLFKIKLAYLPGIELRSEDGRRLPLFHGFPHAIGYGNGRMVLVYERTTAMVAGYVVSLASLCAAGIWILWRKGGAKRGRA
jgi:hypothetical protein